MPRQPVPKKLYHEDWITGRKPLQHRPEHAALIAQCVSSWSGVELQLALMLATLMKTDSPEAVRVYLTLRRSSSRFQALEAAAKGLDELHHDLFQAVIKAVRSVEKERNFIAHGIFAYCDKAPDDIGCMHQDDMIESTIRRISDGSITSDQVAPEDQERLMKNLLVYTVEDLECIVENISKTWGVVHLFNGLIHALNTHQDKFGCLLLCGQLYSQPLLQAFLTHPRTLVLEGEPTVSRAQSPSEP